MPDLTFPGEEGTKYSVENQTTGTNSLNNLTSVSVGLGI